MEKVYKTSPQDLEEARKEVLASSLGDNTKTILSHLITSYLYLIQLLGLLFSCDRSQQRKSRKELKEFVDANQKAEKKSKKKKKKSSNKSDKDNEEGDNQEDHESDASELDDEESSLESGESPDDDSIPLPPDPEPTDSGDSDPKNTRNKRSNNEFNPSRCCTHNHETLNPGDPCPECGIGKVYSFREKIIPILVGQPSIEFEQHHFPSLRCNACLKVYEPALPEEFSKTGKATPTALASGIIMHYFLGVPFSMMSVWQKIHSQYLSPSQVWEDLMSVSMNMLLPIHTAMLQNAATANLLYTDDTPLKILSLMKENKINREKKESKKKAPEDRVAMYSSNIIAVLPCGKDIVLYFHGRKYAGENLADILENRSNGDPIPIQMKDASTMNIPHGFEVIEAKCNSHALRKFKDTADAYPEECEYILKRYQAVFKWDEYCRKNDSSNEERLKIHQDNSKPLMEQINSYCKGLLEEHKVEPNSKFGEAVKYFINHYDGLMAFTKYLGAPLDNNESERVLKLIIRRRKNSFFFKTVAGAEVAEVIQSVIYTAARYDMDGLREYLIAVFQNEEQVSQSPEKWMPWNYKSSLLEAKENSDLSLVTG